MVVRGALGICRHRCRFCQIPTATAKSSSLSRLMQRPIATITPALHDVSCDARHRAAESTTTIPTTRFKVTPFRKIVSIPATLGFGIVPVPFRVMKGRSSNGRLSDLPGSQGRRSRSRSYHTSVGMNC